MIVAWKRNSSSPTNQMMHLTAATTAAATQQQQQQQQLGPEHLNTTGAITGVLPSVLPESDETLQHYIMNDVIK